MKSYIYKIDSFVQNCIDPQTQNEINGAFSILIQLFSGENADKIEKILHALTNTFPKSFIITTSTDGEIYQSEVLSKSSVIVISTFEKTHLKIAFSDAIDSLEAGRELAKEIITEDTKLIISFANGLLCNGEEFLNGISSLRKEVIIAGGLSGDNAKFKRCYVGLNDSLYDKGAVAVSLNSKSLQVHNFYSFGWRPIGVKHKITKAEKNRIYTIDNMSAVSFYRKYLGESTADKLPVTGIEFPLILERNGFQKARATTAIHEDGSLSFAGNIKEGEYVYLGIGDPYNILSDPLHNIDTLNVESFFIYACMARRRFLPDSIYKEIEPFAAIAPTSGFFTYGEFYSATNPEFLNQTLTAVALCESTTVKHIQHKKQHPTRMEGNPTIEALIHIISVTSQELLEQKSLQESINKKLALKRDTLQITQEMAHLANWELNVTSMQFTWSKMSYKLYNYPSNKQPPTFLEFTNMILPKDRKKFMNFQEKLKDFNVHSVELQVQCNDGKILNIIERAKLIRNDAKPIKIVGISLDITDIRKKDELLMQQSKSAQMGDMINMIAHQWRQPLNAISAATIKLGMQSELDMLTKEEIEKTMHFIEKMTQKMSQTINDFMEFNKPTNQKEDINFDEIIEDILKIMGSQLTNNNIKLHTSIEKDLYYYTYKKELEHVLINLIANAKDALEALDDTQKNINIYIYKKQQLYVIKIADNAGGIDDDVIHRIFDPYFTTKDSYKGTGLGLYMSKKILQEYLHGDIFVRNKNAGAEFTIILDGNDE